MNERGRVAIRAAGLGDVARLVEIENASFSSDRISPRSFRRQIASPTLTILVAITHGVVQGYGLVAFRNRSRHARLYSLAVAVGSERGLGRMLLAACEANACERQWDAMRLEVRESNSRAIGIYEATGYRRIGRRDDYYEDGAAALLYEKRLR